MLSQAFHLSSILASHVINKGVKRVQRVKRAINRLIQIAPTNGVQIKKDYIPRRGFLYHPPRLPSFQETRGSKKDYIPRRGFVLVGQGEYGRPADQVVDNRSDLDKVIAAPVVGQRTYRDARGPIYDVSVAYVRQAGRKVDWPGSSAYDTSIPKPSEYLFDGGLYSSSE